MQLKNVVFPAPLGPMIETMPLRGTSKVTSFTATRPPKTFEMFVASRMFAPSPGRCRTAVAAPL